MSPMDMPICELDDSSRDTGSNLEQGDQFLSPFLSALSVFFPLPCPVKIVVTRTLLITADLLAGLALAMLLLGLDCIKFLKEEPRVKLKMCYGAGVILGLGSVCLPWGQMDLMSHREPGGGQEPGAPPQRGLWEHGGSCMVPS